MMASWADQEKGGGQVEDRIGINHTLITTCYQYNGRVGQWCQRLADHCKAIRLPIPVDGHRERRKREREGNTR